MPSIFDFNSVSETVYKGAIPNPDWILIPEGEYPGQASKLDGREVQNRKIDGSTVWCDISWEILDEKVKKETNMERPTARQSFSLAMIKDKEGNNTGQLDLSENTNMTLKAVWKACGIHKDPSVNKIKNQTAWIKVEHVAMKDSDGTQRLDPEGRPIYTANVTRVTSLEAARASQRRNNGT